MKTFEDLVESLPVIEEETGENEHSFKKGDWAQSDRLRGKVIKVTKTKVHIGHGHQHGIPGSTSFHHSKVKAYDPASRKF